RLRPAPGGLSLLPQPPLPQVSGGDTGTLVGAAEPTPAAGGVLPRRVYLAGGGGRGGVGQSGDGVQPAVPGGQGDLDGSGGRLPASGGGAWRAAGAAHLGAEPAPPSARAWRGDGRWPVVQRAGGGGRVATLGVVPTGVLLAGAGAEPGISGQVPGRAASGVRGGQVALGRLAECGGLRVVDSAVVQSGLGGVCQGTVWRTGAGVEVPGALHAPGGHQQQPVAGDDRGGRGDLPLQGLQARVQAATDDPGGRGVRAALAATRIAARLREDTALRAV